MRSREVQATALKFGFRAADVDVPVMTADPANPFTKYASNGIKVDIPASRTAPASKDVHALLAQWKKLPR